MKSIRLQNAAKVRASRQGTKEATPLHLGVKYSRPAEIEIPRLLRHIGAHRWRGFENPVPPGDGYTETPVRVLAMMVNMIILQTANKFGSPCLVQKIMHVEIECKPKEESVYHREVILKMQSSEG